LSSATFLIDCLSNLQSIDLPDLQLPRSRFTEVDRGRVYFGIRYYAYASIAHFRSVLSGLVMLADDANWACANILTRHVFEWAAHATFAELKLGSLVRQERWDKAWGILLKLNAGDLYFRRFGSKYLRSEDKDFKVPQPYELADILAVYDSQWAAEDGRGAAKEDHSLLSELSHASAACLRQHQTTYENHIAFEPDEDSSPLYLASSSTMEWLLCMAKLLALVPDDAVGVGVLAALKCIAENAPAHKEP
jgi:hypothetical protein